MLKNLVLNCKFNQKKKKPASNKIPQKKLNELYKTSHKNRILSIHAEIDRQ